MDGVTYEMFQHELVALYMCQGFQAHTPLPPVQLTFRDYACAIAARRGGALREAAEAYWLGRLDRYEIPGPPEVPQLGNGTRSARGFVHRGGRLAAAEWAAVKKWLAGNGVTPTLGLLAVYAATLQRWSGSDRPDP